MKKPIIAVVAATIINMVVGWLWYSPFLFGNVWARLAKQLLGIEMDPTVIFYGTLLAFWIACFLVYFVHTMNLDYKKMVQLVFFGWLAFTVPYGLQGVIYGGYDPKLFAIDTSYNLVVYILMSLAIVYIHHSPFLRDKPQF